MSDDLWTVRDGFASWTDYEAWLARLEAAADRGAAERIPVGTRYSNADFDEHWYSEPQGGRVWRLVGPDPPFPGLFAPVDPAAPHRSLDGP